MFKKQTVLAKAQAALAGVLAASGLSLANPNAVPLKSPFGRKRVQSVTGIYGRNPKRTTAAAQRRASIKARNKKLHPKGC